MFELNIRHTDCLFVFEKTKANNNGRG